MRAYPHLKNRPDVRLEPYLGENFDSFYGTDANMEIYSPNNRAVFLNRAENDKRNRAWNGSGHGSGPSGVYIENPDRSLATLDAHTATTGQKYQWERERLTENRDPETGGVVVVGVQPWAKTSKPREWLDGVRQTYHHEDIHRTQHLLKKQGGEDITGESKDSLFSRYPSLAESVAEKGYDNSPDTFAAEGAAFVGSGSGHELLPSKNDADYFGVVSPDFNSRLNNFLRDYAARIAEKHGLSALKRMFDLGQGEPAFGPNPAMVLQRVIGEYKDFRAKHGRTPGIEELGYAQKIAHKIMTSRLVVAACENLDRSGRLELSDLFDAALSQQHLG